MSKNLIILFLLVTCGIFADGESKKMPNHLLLPFKVESIIDMKIWKSSINSRIYFVHCEKYKNIENDLTNTILRQVNNVIFVKVVIDSKFSFFESEIHVDEIYMYDYHKHNFIPFDKFLKISETLKAIDKSIKTYEIEITDENIDERFEKCEIIESYGAGVFKVKYENKDRLVYCINNEKLDLNPKLIIYFNFESFSNRIVEPIYARIPKK